MGVRHDLRSAQRQQRPVEFSSSSRDSSVNTLGALQAAPFHPNGRPEKGGIKEHRAYSLALGRIGRTNSPPGDIASAAIAPRQVHGKLSPINPSDDPWLLDMMSSYKR
jgi:hypothetical protein